MSVHVWGRRRESPAIPTVILTFSIDWDFTMKDYRSMQLEEGLKHVIIVC